MNTHVQAATRPAVLPGRCPVYVPERAAGPGLGSPSPSPTFRTRYRRAAAGRFPSVRLRLPLTDSRRSGGQQQPVFADEDSEGKPGKQHWRPDVANVPHCLSVAEGLHACLAHTSHAACPRDGYAASSPPRRHLPTLARTPHLNSLSLVRKVQLSRPNRATRWSAVRCQAGVGCAGSGRWQVGCGASAQTGDLHARVGGGSPVLAGTTVCLARPPPTHTHHTARKISFGLVSQSYM